MDYIQILDFYNYLKYNFSKIIILILFINYNINIIMSDIVAKIRAEKNSNIDTLILEASNVEISNNIGLIIPVGTTLDRESVNSRRGAIRFNSTDSAFEGYDGINWGTLGGVKDVSQTTLIRAETSPGANNKQLDFIIDGEQRMQIDSNGDFKFGDIGNQDIKFSINYESGDVSAIKIESQDIVSNQITVNNLLSTQNISAENIIPKTDNTYSLGNSTNKWKELYLDSNGINIGNNASIIKDANNSIVLNNDDGNFKITGNLTISGNLTIPGENIQAGGQLISDSNIIDTPIGIDKSGAIGREEALFTKIDVNDESLFKNHITIYKDKKIKFANQAGSDTTNLINGNFASIDVSSNSIFRSDLNVQKGLIVDGSLNVGQNLKINGTINLPDSSNNGYGVSGEVLTNQGSTLPPIWRAPSAIPFAYYQINTDQTGVPSGSETKLVLKNEVVANPIVTSNAAGTDFTINEAGTYKFEASVFVSPTEYSIYYLQLDLYHTPISTGTSSKRSESIIDTRNGAGIGEEDFRNLSLNLFYVQPNLEVGDEIFISVKPLYNDGSLKISHPGSSALGYQGSTKLLITKLA